MKLTLTFRRPRSPTRLVAERMSLEELDAIGAVAQSPAYWPGLREWCYLTERQRGPQ